jgi:uncharacterized protein (DUF305 family)
MSNSYSLKIFAFFLLLIFGWSCKGTSQVTEDTTSEDKIDREAIYWARVDSAKMEFTEADAKFMTMMIGHHAQALVMSRLAPENGASDQVQTLAARIINSQKDEIATMQQWLRERNQPTVDLKIEGLKLMINGMRSGHMDMVGMLSQNQLEELSNARGTEFDRLFLKYMISHHKGAVVMVDNLLKVDGAAQEEAAFKLASGINADQQTEIARMQSMLDKLTSSSQ